MSRSLSPSTNTLLEGSGSRASARPAVYDVLDRPVETNLLVLSYSEGPDAWLRNWRTHAGDLPERVGFVHIGAATRSAAGADGDASADGFADPSLADASSRPDAFLPDAVSDPTDLAQVGICVSEYLEAWDDDRETLVFFESLTDLLDHVSLHRAFKFLQVLTARIENADGHGYYLVDSSAHGTTSLAALRELVDAAVTLDEPHQR